MSEAQPTRFSVGFGIRLFVFTQLFAIGGGVSLALLPFAMVWLLGTAVSHNSNYLAGLGWYAVVATAIVVMHFAWHKFRSLQGTPDKQSLSEKFASAGAVISVPVVMYLCAQYICRTESGDLSSADLIAWSWFYIQTHLDIVTVGLYSTILPDGSILKPDEVLGRILVAFARALYTLGVIAFVGHLIRGTIEQHKSTFTSFRDSSARLVAFTVLFLVYNLLMVGATAIASLLPWTVAAVGTPVLVHGILQALILPAVHKARQTARLMRSHQNMREILHAFFEYQSFHNGNFPPRFNASLDGTPLLSWRVHLLPHLGMQELHDQFNLDEPWNSPHNLPLSEKLPEIYHSLNSSQSAKTHYLVVAGKGTCYESESGTSSWKGSDPTNSALLVEADLECARPWTQPEDFNFDANSPRDGLGTLQAGKLVVGLTSAEVKLLNMKQLTDENLTQFLQRKG